MVTQIAGGQNVAQIHTTNVMRRTNTGHSAWEAATKISKINTIETETSRLAGNAFTLTSMMVLVPEMAKAARQSLTAARKVRFVLSNMTVGRPAIQRANGG